ncbi:hypothetical protein R6Q59_007141, partial [Mikania micrantha]
INLVIWRSLRHHPTSYSNDVVLNVLIRKGYEGEYPPLVKKLLHPYWQLQAHMIQMGILGNRGGIDVLSAELTSEITTGPNVSGLLKQTRKGAQVTFQGLRPLEKFGRFGEIENVDQISEANAIIAEEHDVQARVAGHEDEQVNPEIEFNPGEDVVVEMIDQEFDSTLNEAGSRTHRVVRDATKGKEVDVALVNQKLSKNDESDGLQDKRDDNDDDSGPSNTEIDKTQDSELGKGDAGPSGTNSDMNQEFGMGKGKVGSSQQEDDKLMFDIDDLQEENVEVTEIRDTGKRNEFSSAEYDYSNVDKWVAGKRIDTSKRLIIPSVRKKDCFKQEQDLPEKYVVTTGRNYYDQVGDRSGIHSWHYDGDNRMCVVKRKSGNLEYYESPLDFESWTRVDLVELDEVPFLIGQMIQDELNFMIFFMKRYALTSRE